MTPSIKALGLARLAIAAMSAFAAASAQAAVGEAHITTTEKAVLTGDGTNGIVRIGTSEVKCTTVQFEGTVQNGVNGWQQDGLQLTGKHIAGTPRFEGCEFAALKAAAQVRMNGCKYTLEGTAELTAQAKVVGCTAGRQIEVIAAGGLCTITLGEQAALKHVTFINDKEGEATKHHVQDHTTLSGITYTRDGAFCPQGEMTYQGTTTIKAYKDLGTEAVQDPVTGHNYTKHLCGAEVGILGT